MTQPQLPALVDPGNQHLTTDLQADLMLGKIPVPGGEAGVATIRQGNTTLTLTFDKASAEQWAENFSRLAAMLSGSGLVVAGQGLVTGTNGQRK